MAEHKYKPIPPMTEADAARFWRKVDKSAGPDACWPWMGVRLAPNPNNPERPTYGTFYLHKRDPYCANRIAYFLTHREDPGMLCTLHSCDNPPCRNGSHISSGTHSDNVADMISKKRNRPIYGERHPGSVMSDLQRSESLKMFLDGVTSKRIAAHFGLNRETVKSAIYAMRKQAERQYTPATHTN